LKSNSITVDIGLPEFRVVRYKRSKNRYEIWLEKRLDFGICPTCGHPTSSYHDSYERTVQDLPIMGTPVFLHIFQRRYHCPNCKRHFNESFESVDVYQRQTRRLQEYLARSVRESSVALAAKKSEIGYRIVERLYYKGYESFYSNTSKPLPKRIGMDDFATRKGCHYGTVFVDLGSSKAKVIEAIPGRSEEDIANFFKSHTHLREVTEVSMDMWKAFLFAVRRYCPRAKIIVDRFHVIKLAGKALNNCRKRLQKKKELKGSIKSISKLLFSPQDELKPEDQKRLKGLFTEVPELRKAYRLYHFLRYWYNAGNLGKARKLLSYWMYQVKKSGIPEFLKLAKTIRKWRKEILNYFRAFLTNGAVEGIINKIKLIKRVTYGLPNFEHLRARILIECGCPP